MDEGVSHLLYPLHAYINGYIYQYCTVDITEKMKIYCYLSFIKYTILTVFEHHKRWKRKAFTYLITDSDNRYCFTFWWRSIKKTTYKNSDTSLSEQDYLEIIAWNDHHLLSIYSWRWWRLLLKMINSSGFNYFPAWNEKNGTCNENVSKHAYKLL